MKWVSPVERTRRSKRACLGALQKTKNTKNKNKRGTKRSGRSVRVSHEAHVLALNSFVVQGERERERNPSASFRRCVMRWEIPNKKTKCFSLNFNTRWHQSLGRFQKMFQGEEEEEGESHTIRTFCFLSLSLSLHSKMEKEIWPNFLACFFFHHDAPAGGRSWCKGGGYMVV